MHPRTEPLRLSYFFSRKNYRNTSMGFILFILRLANSVAAIYSVAVVTMVITAMFFDFKTMHPDWVPKVGEPEELAKAVLACILIFLCPLLNIVFAHFCMDYQQELREELSKKLEEELPEA